MVRVRPPIRSVDTMKMNKVDGYWRSDFCLEFSLDKPIEDVEEFGDSLYAFLKWQAREGNIPFKILDMYPLYTCRRYNGKRTYWKKGYIMIHVKKRALKSYFNPFHDNKDGDETIVIHFKDNGKYLASYQEIKSEYIGYRVTWKFSLSKIKAFREIINKFCAGYWLGINTLLQDQDKGKEDK